MPFQIIRDDITRVRCDAIVNAAKSTLLGGGGVDGAIHAAAGPELKKECARLGGCPTGKAKITAGYALPCRYVIHTVGPVWHGGDQNEEQYLRSCYRESLALAAENGCESVAFPLISAGIFGYPREEALQIAVDEISRFLLHHDMLITLVIRSKSSFCLSRRLIDNVAEYIDDVYVEAPAFPPSAQFAAPERAVKDKARFLKPAGRTSKHTAPMEEHSELSKRAVYSCAPSIAAQIPLELDESFAQMLLRKIDEKGMTDAECYKKANIDRKLFSKIRKDPQYRPSKTTAIAFAIALELPLDETGELLRKAGFALSRSNKFDVIIEYFIKHRNYNIFEINEVLFAFDQNLLGA